MSTLAVRTRTAKQMKKARTSDHDVKPLISVKAEPLSEDDFEDDAKREAKDYSTVQQTQSDRAHITEENRRRKKQGLSLLKLPPKEKALKREIDSYRSEDESNEPGPSFRINKIKGRDDNLVYEGQVILDYNPLYRLAGLTSPEAHMSKEQVTKARFLQKVTTPSRPGSPSGTRSATTMRNGCLVKKEHTPSPAESNIKRVVQLSPHTDTEVKPVIDGAPGGRDDEGNDYSDDDDVVVPWAQPLDPVKTAYMDVKSSMNSEHEEEEPVYSDDEAFAPTVKAESQSQPTQPPICHRTTGEIPPNRPYFPLAPNLAEQGAHVLDETSPDIAIPPSINKYLKPYQRSGVDFLYKKYKAGSGGILGDDMGLGKTIQVISFLSAIMRKTGTDLDHQRRKNTIRRLGENISPRHWPTALIVCPNSLVRNWQRELNTWGYFETAIWKSDNCTGLRTTFGHGYLDLVLVSYETARNTIELLKNMDFSVVIADEAHRLKEPRAALTIAMKKIQCVSCFGLTGTLIQNRMDEMWSVLDFVDRGHAGTLAEWREFAVNPIKRGHRYDGTAEEVVTGTMRLGVVYGKILPHFYLRRDKRLIASELPQKRDMVMFCPLADRQVRAYQALVDSDDVQYILRRNDPCECGSNRKRVDCCHPKTQNGETLREVQLKYVSAFTKVANHFGLLYHGKDDTEHMRDVNTRIYKTCTGEDYDSKAHNVVQAALDAENCGKWTLLSELLGAWREESVGNKVLLFSNSVRLLKMIAEFISTSNDLSGFSFDMLTGEASAEERMGMVDRFQDPEQDYFILLISTLAGGVGLNLTAANKVVIFDPSWNPANDLQAMDRAFRIGQRRTVDVYRLIGKGTLEEAIYERQIHKQQKSRQLNDGTFESRIHHGFDGAKSKEDQGELFGIHNLFRFNPEGFVSNNLERVRQAEDQFVQDLIEGDYVSEGIDGEESEGEVAKQMKEDNRDRDLRKAQENSAQRRNDQVLREMLDEDSVPRIRREDATLRALGVTSHVHDTAFRDSPEERKIYEIGVRLLQSNPQAARTIKANDLGKLAHRELKPEGKGKGKAIRKGTDPDDEPWKDRIQNKREAHSGTKRMLAELSD